MQTNRPLNLTFEIAKVDEDRRQVWGYATVEVPDKQGDIVDYAASLRAFAAWPGNIREQHDAKKAVGTCITWSGDPERKAIYLGAYISKSPDGEATWTKVKEGVLKGFSIKGEVLDSAPEIHKDAAGSRTLNRIRDYRLDEVSLVDNPACPVARITMVKATDGGLEPEADDAPDLSTLIERTYGLTTKQARRLPVAVAEKLADFAKTAAVAAPEGKDMATTQDVAAGQFQAAAALEEARALLVKDTTGGDQHGDDTTTDDADARGQGDTDADADPGDKGASGDDQKRKQRGDDQSDEDDTAGSHGKDDGTEGMDKAASADEPAQPSVQEIAKAVAAEMADQLRALLPAHPGEQPIAATAEPGSLQKMLDTDFERRSTVLAKAADLDRVSKAISKVADAVSALEKAAQRIDELETRLSRVEAQPAADPNAPALNALSAVEKTIGELPAAQRKGRLEKSAVDALEKALHDPATPAQQRQAIGFALALEEMRGANS